MSKILFLIYFFSTYCIYAQNEVSSFYFKSPQPAETDSTFEFQEKYWGSYYKSSDSLIRLIIDKDSIFTEFTVMMSLSQQEFEKNKKLAKTDSLLFGIKKGSGIPYMILNDTIYAVIIQYDLFFKADKNHILKFKDSQYFLNSKKENGCYSTSMISFKKDSLSLQEIDHSGSMDLIKKFKYLTEQNNNNIKIYLAAPSSEELNNFIKEKGFNDLVKYHK